MSYSQYGEDVIIAQLLGDGGTRRLLDIGAWDPITFSNSRALIEAGWTAVLVEPSPGPLQKLVREYGSNERVAVVGAVVSATTGDQPLTGMAFTDDAVSTTTEGVYRVWREAGGYYGRAWVKPITLPEIFELFGKNFDFVNIDTEGTSVDVAMKYLEFVVSRQRPRVMCVEHDGRIKDLLEFAAPHGYSARHENGTNVIISL